MWNSWDPLRFYLFIYLFLGGGGEERGSDLGKNSFCRSTKKEGSMSSKEMLFVQR